MSLFFKHLGIGIVSVLTAFSGAFHSNPVPVAQGSVTKNVATSSLGAVYLHATTTPSQKPVGNPVKVNSTTNNNSSVNASQQAAQQASLIKQVNDLRAQQATQLEKQSQQAVTEQQAHDAANQAISAPYYEALKAESDIQAQETARLSSSSCIQAKSAYDSMEQQFHDNVVLSSNTPVGTQQFSQINSQGADIAIKLQPLMQAYYLACYDYLPATTPVSPYENSYINVDGNTVESPSYTNSVGATAQCNDGTYSFSQNRSGTCSYHGGVAEWLQ